MPYADDDTEPGREPMAERVVYLEKQYRELAEQLEKLADQVRGFHARVIRELGF